ncbi:DEAD/DEAH box helicase family protein [Flavobacterium flavigenum]|uniref:DEAD/DEAH box helicase family protein n=1 Tax=Flavobacterium flavigenum TaxID=3003258 RepID=UPI0024832B7B|nr:DEAD/DEAH box helicase family protein [Flavobacterium flavigenum]
MSKEAKARIKINHLLEEAGWSFFDSETNKANILLEHRTKKAKFDNSKLGEDLENAPDGFIDYLLLNELSRPIALVEAKRENIDPLNAKEQAREYARAQHIRHIFLSNGNLHYYWDLEYGEPTVISKFLSIAQLNEAIKWSPSPEKMNDLQIDENYIAISQDANWLTYTEAQKQEARTNKGIKQLRDYQVQAIQRLKGEYINGKNRFLFEMATGTGKTLLSAGIIKIFIRSGNADRVLFLVDRIELERQAHSAFKKYLEDDAIQCVIYKRNKTNWQSAKVVVSTIQSLAYDNRFQKEFSPSDFQLIISDEAHRTINGNNRVIFDYFIGAKLGLTATPKDYLKGVAIDEADPREMEKRLLLSTYETFGCADGTPTYRFSLEDAVKHKPPYLCLPKLLDARTDITTDLLSKQGWTHKFTNEEGDEEEDTFYKKDFMRKFFSHETNKKFVETFLKYAKKDPISNEIGKTIFFCVSRAHCRIMTKLLNEEASKLYPEQYGGGSFFALQITSDIMGSQDRTTRFSNNDLNGHSSFNPELFDYESSKTRVCVTVGMMTTGYDCTDILNVVLSRPIFSPTDYIQIKGRGTRLHTFDYKDTSIAKDNFHLFDFFANHEYFEDEFDYKQKIELPKETENEKKGGVPNPPKVDLNYLGADEVKSFTEEEFSADKLMKVDKEAFSKQFESATVEEVQKNPELQKAVEEEDWNSLSAYVQENIFEKPSEFWNLDKLLTSYGVDRRASLKEIMMKIFLKDYKLKTREDLANDYFQKFISEAQFDNSKYNPAKRLWDSYLLYEDIREKINSNSPDPNDARFGLREMKELGKDNRIQIVNYIKDNISINQFLPR